MALLCACAAGMSGCVDSLPDLQVSKGDVRTAIARGQIASPRNATIAMASFDGAPGDVSSRFTALFAKAAADREISVVDGGSARYLVRGYLSANPSDAGTEIGYVYDIFDGSDRQRLNRVSDALTVRGGGPDAWSMVDDAALASLAGRSADELAVALAGTPEAQTGAGVASAGTGPAATPVN